MCTQYRDFFTAFEAAIMLFYGYDLIKFVYFSFTLKQTLIVTHGHQLKKNLPVRKTTGDNATWNEHVYKKKIFMDHQVFKLFSCTCIESCSEWFFCYCTDIWYMICRAEPKGEIKDKNISKYFVNICVRLQKYYITVLYISEKHFTLV